MASLTLKNIKKVYPHSEETKKSKKKKGEEQQEKKVNLQITDEGVVAVQQFSLDIQDKEFIVLVGPSGCGKSTTLRMIAGLEEITDGELYIGDRLVNDVEPKDRDIAMVFQNYALYPHMTVYENMAFPLKLRKFPKDKRDEIRLLLLEGHAVFLEVETMRRLNEEAYADRLHTISMQRSDVYGVGYRLLRDYILEKNDLGSHMTPFSSMNQLLDDILNGTVTLP